MYSSWQWQGAAISSSMSQRRVQAMHYRTEMHEERRRTIKTLLRWASRGTLNSWVQGRKGAKGMRQRRIDTRRRSHVRTGEGSRVPEARAMGEKGARGNII